MFLDSDQRSVGQLRRPYTKSQQLVVVDDFQISFALIHWWRTMEVRHVYSSIIARGLQGISPARSCEEDEGWSAGSAAFGAGGHLRWVDPHRGGEDWRRDAADHPR